MSKIDFERVGTSGSEVVRLDDPIILSSAEVSEAILGRENI